MERSTCIEYTYWNGPCQYLKDFSGIQQGGKEAGAAYLFSTWQQPNKQNCIHLTRNGPLSILYASGPFHLIVTFTCEMSYLWGKVVWSRFMILQRQRVLAKVRLPMR